MIEKLCSAFGGFGIDVKNDERQKKAIDSFNKLLLEFSLKLDSAVGIKNSKMVLPVVVSVTKASDSAIVDNYLRLLGSNEKLLKNRNPMFLGRFPVEAATPLKKMNPATQKSIWQYLDTLAERAKVYKEACESNPMRDLSKLKLDGLFGGTLIEIKQVLKRNEVDPKKLVRVIGEIVDCLPIDSVLEQIPDDPLPGGLTSNMKQNDLREKLCNVLNHVLASDDDDAEDIES